MARTGRPTARIELSDEDTATLRRYAARARSARTLAFRSNIILACASGLRDVDVAAKLQRAQELLSHTPAGRDLALLVESALDLLIPKLESRRLGKLERSAPRPRATPARSRRVSRAVRRDVFERDGEQCTYLSEDGQRCSSRSLLELDHIRPRALGGADDTANLRVRCRAHNQLWAEQVYGREHMARQRNLRQRKYTAGPAGEFEDGDEPAEAQVL